MSIEFSKIHRFHELEDFVSQVELQPEWEDFMTIRESVKRIISIRGRLLGEKHTDIDDLMYDLNSYCQLGMKEDKVTSALQTAVLVEGTYYEYAQRLAVFFAEEGGYLERIPEYKDVAKEIVAWNLWFRWKPRGDITPNGLHYSMVASLRFIPYQTYKAYLHKLPYSSLFEDIEDRGNKISFPEKIKERPKYRLRRTLGGFSLEDIFRRLSGIPNREKLSILCVMGYVPGIKNITQSSKHFNIDKEAFREAFDRGLDKILKIRTSTAARSAKEIVEESVSRGVIFDPNGKAAYFNSPRMKFLEMANPEGLDELSLKIFTLAKALDGDRFRYSLAQIGELAGGLSKMAVAKRIARILGQIEMSEQTDT